MDKLDRIRACYQHCCLKYVVGEMMTNQTLRERLKIDEKNYSMVSRVIKEATEKNLIKPYDINAGTKSIRYIPNWA
jgi:predicted HTH transcriptional regulator